MDNIDEYNNFIDNWDRLINELQDELPMQFLQPNGFQDVDEMNTVIDNAGQGIKENGLNRLRNVRNYLINVRQDLNQNYPPNYNDDEEAWENHEEKLQLVNSLINTLEPRFFARMAEILTPDDIIVLRNMRRQKRIPEDMEGEIASFVGTKPHGGRKSRKNKKRKITRKHKTRRHKTRRHKTRKHKTRKSSKKS